MWDGGAAIRLGLVCCHVSVGLTLPTQGQSLERHPEGEGRGTFANAGLQVRLCAHLFTQWFVMASCAAGCVLARPPAGAGCCLMKLLWGCTLCQGSHVLCPMSGSHSTVVPGTVSVGDRASLPFLCWAPGRVWRAPQRRAGPCFCGCWVWCCLGFHWCRDRLGSLPSLPSSLQPCRLLTCGCQLHPHCSCPTAPWPAWLGASAVPTAGLRLAL